MHAICLVQRFLSDTKFQNFVILHDEIELRILLLRILQ
jgi:hypothetical protein